MKRFLSVFLAVSLCMTAFVGLFAMGTSGETSEIYLSDLDYIPNDGQGNGSWAGWSDIKINQTVNGGVPKINNGDGSAAMTFEKAVIAHASAQIEYDISGLDANRFMSYIGICADAGYYASASSCVFEVRVDGVSLYKSETILFSSAAEYVNVVIPDGAQKLTLIIDGLGDITADHAGWFDAKLLTGDELVEPTEVVFEKPLYAAEVGEAISVNAIALPEGADAGDMIFGVEDSSIATVTADGKVYPRKAGCTNLTVKLPLYGLEAKAELRVLSDGVYELDTDTWTTVMSSDSNPIPREQPSANVLHFPIAYGNTNQDPGNALLQDASAGDFVLTVKVSGGLSADYQAVGLVAYAGHAQMVAMTRRYHTYLGGNIFCIATYAEETSYVDIAVADPAPRQDAFLKLEKKGDVFTGSYSFDGQNWTTITDTITSSDIANAEDLKVGVTAMTSLGGYVDTYLQDFTMNGEAVPFSYQCGDILLEVEEGKEAQVVPGFIGADAYNTATYTAEGYEDIISIDENGVITGKKPGVAWVCATKGEEEQWFEVHVVSGTIGQFTENWTLVNGAATKPTLNTENPNQLSMPILNGDFGRTISNLVLMDAPAGDFDIRVKVSGGLSSNFESIGLVAYHNETNGIAVERRSHSYFGGNVFCITNYQGSGNEPYVAETDSTADAYVRLVRTGDKFTGYYSYNGEDWTAITEAMTNATVSSSTQLKIGLIARSGSYASDKTATYTDFTLDGTVIPFTEIDCPVELQFPTFDAVAGETLEMPETVSCYMASGVYKDCTVTAWDLSGVDFEEAGSYDITITVDGVTLPAYVCVCEPEVPDVDLNGDGATTIGDVAHLLDYLAGKGAELMADGDVNSDGSVTIADVAALLDILAGK